MKSKNKMSLSSLGLILALALQLSACHSAGSQADSPDSSDGFTKSKVDLNGSFKPEPCWFEHTQDRPIECGYITVAADHFHSDDRTIKLAVVVLRDAGPTHQPDPVILLAGGPGERVAAAAMELSSVLVALHPDRDLVIYDQRGVGLSEPALECPEFLDAMFDNLDEPDNGKAAKSQFDALMTCRDRFLADDIDLSVYNTRQSAADVQAVRTALGYDEINLYGASYGSQLAQAVVREFPAGIRSVAMNSVLPIEKSIFLDTSTTASNAILALISACETDTACNRAFPALRQELFDTVEELNIHPMPMTLTDPLSGKEFEALLTGDGVVGNLFTFLYISRYIPVLPQAIHNSHEGNYSMMRQLSSTRIALLDALTRGTMLSVLCRDDLIGRTPREQLEIRSSLPDPLMSDISDEAILTYGAFGLCESWPVEEFASWVKEPLVSDIPTLLLAGEFDPITPPEYARLVFDGLTNAHLVELPATGHDVLSNECARTITRAFIQDPFQSPPLSCVSDLPELTFDIPTEAPVLALESFVDKTRGFKGLIPVGWEELAPANLSRRTSALDPAYFVLEAAPGTKSELFANLSAQIGMDPSQAPERTAQLGFFRWDFYVLDRGEAIINLAMTEEDDTAYFVLLVSPAGEHDVLLENLFIPAVEALIPIG